MAKLTLQELDEIERNLWREFLSTDGDPTVATTENIEEENHECCESP